MRTPLIMISAVVLLSGCSAFKKSRITAYYPEYGTGIVEAEQITTRPISGDDKSDGDGRSWSTRADDAEKSDVYNRIDRDNNMADSKPDPAMFSFKDVETQHVKFSYYDPFKDKSYLYYDLDEMAKGFHYPCDGWFISDYGMRSGRMHTGVDLKALPLSNVYAAFDGVVRMSKAYSSYGNVVVIRHYNGLETVYSHNARNTVRSGDKVKAGDVIAKVGRTGRATTEHVHFETRVLGQCFNPNLLIDVKNNKLKSGGLYLYKRNGVVSASSRPLATLSEVPETNDETSVSAPSTGTSQSNKGGSSSTGSSSSGRKTIKVVRGDTLYGLARRYGTTVDRLKSLNGLRSNTIYAGQQLRVR